MAETIQKVTVTLLTSKKQDAAKILQETPDSSSHSRILLGLAGRELRCARGDRDALEAGSTATFVFGRGANVKAAKASDPTNQTMADVHAYPVYIRFSPLPDTVDSREDDWCLEHVKVVVESDKGRKVEFVGLEGSTRLFLGSEGGYVLYLHPGGRGPTIVRGSVSKEGKRVAGNGFTVTRAHQDGDFTITFSVPFPEPPIVTVSIFGPQDPRSNAHVREATAAHAVISTGVVEKSRTAYRAFHFTATAVSDG
ncbi:hypothetical protein [Actinomadura terrae]|uniref:hypothetical protein n=1 Tax=Actinomadura terrae TaxID=604353 RepID=UPI001FA7A3FE|nr:hypothetical protein [Actinomadura terrae]